MDGSRGLEGGKPSNVFILWTEVILAMTYDHLWAFVSAVMNHPLLDFQGCQGWGWGFILGEGGIFVSAGGSLPMTKTSYISKQRCQWNL